MKRREFIAGLGNAVAVAPMLLARNAHAQQRAMPVIGWLGSTLPQPDHVNPFLEGLKDEGYVENSNIAIQYRWAEGRYDRLPAFAAEFVQRPVDLIAAITTVSAVAARNATSSVPTVFLTGGDPIQLGLVASMNRPGGNRTGVTLITHTLDAKRIEVLRELVPTARTIGAILNPNSATAQSNQADVQAAARTLDLQLVIANVTGEQDLASAFAVLSAQRIDALLVGADSLLHSLNRPIVRLAEQHRFPAVYEWREHTQIGGLISYGTNMATLFRQVGSYGGRILKGAKPSDFPVLGPSKFELAINLKTAKALGLTAPPTLLARADEVIE